MYYSNDVPTPFNTKWFENYNNYMVHTFSYASEHVAQIDDLVAWIVFGYGHRPPSPQLPQT